VYFPPLRVLVFLLATSPAVFPDHGSAQNTMSSGSAREPRYDAQGRVITAGGFVDTGPVVFQDVTRAAGLSGWRHVMGGSEKTFILESNGSGIGLIDYDNDGWLDIYMANGSTFPALAGKEPAPHAALFHNNHDGTFTDVAEKAGVANHDGKFVYVPPVKNTGLAVLLCARGAAFGDLFNDGKIDVVISPIDGPPVLLRDVNPDHHHWVELNLAGGEGSPRDAVGAKVFLKANGVRMRQDVLSSGSYISANTSAPTSAWVQPPTPGRPRFSGLQGALRWSVCPRRTGSTPSPRARALPRPCAKGAPARFRMRPLPPFRNARLRPTLQNKACDSAISATNSSTYGGSRLPRPGFAVYSFTMRRCR